MCSDLGNKFFYSLNVNRIEDGIEDLFSMRSSSLRYILTGKNDFSVFPIELGRVIRGESIEMCFYQRNVH